jgi:hypothetical protein
VSISFLANTLEADAIMNPEEYKRMNTKKHLYKLIFAKTAFSRVHYVSDFIEQEIKEPDHPLYQPLMTSVCVMYGKPFTNNSGVGMLSEKLIKFDDKSLTDTHEILMDSRHKFYAHTDAELKAHNAKDEHFAIQDAFFTIKYVPEGGKQRAVIRTGMADIKVRPTVIPSIKRLCLALLERINIEEERALKELLDGTYIQSGAYRINWEEP